MISKENFDNYSVKSCNFWHKAFLNYDMRIIVYEPGTRITHNYHCGSEAIKAVAASLGNGLAKK